MFVCEREMVCACVCVCDRFNTKTIDFSLQRVRNKEVAKMTLVNKEKVQQKKKEARDREQ